MGSTALQSNGRLGGGRPCILATYISGSSQDAGDHDQNAEALELKEGEHAKKDGVKFKPDITWVRQQISQRKEEITPNMRTNYFSGEPWHEEDSPGNYTLRETSNGVEYVWYDIDGGENVVPLFQEKH